MKAKNNEVVDFTNSLTSQLFELLGVKAEIKVKPLKEKDQEALEVEISVDSEAGLLIGSHGTTLNSIQSFLGMALRQHFDRWIRVDVDVADWKDKQQEHLASLAHQTAERVKATGQEQPLYNLNASQRRIVHMALSEEDGVTTESQGEGEERYLLVKPKSS